MGFARSPPGSSFRVYSFSRPVSSLLCSLVFELPILVLEVLLLLDFTLFGLRWRLSHRPLVLPQPPLHPLVGFSLPLACIWFFPLEVRFLFLEAGPCGGPPFYPPSYTSACPKRRTFSAPPPPFFFPRLVDFPDSDYFLFTTNFLTLFPWDAVCRPPYISVLLVLSRT